MTKFLRALKAAAAAGLLALTGCAVQAPPLVQQPLTARPQPQPAGIPANGSIFQVASYRPLFEDAMPGRVGDTLTVKIQETTSSSSSEQSTGDRKNSITESVSAGVKLPFIPGYLEKELAGTSLSANGAGSHSGKGTNQMSSSFVSSITVTVIEVLANGNLMVSGEKLVRVNDDNEAIRLSGIVNPRDIAPDRSISSLKLADARLEQMTRGNNRLYNEPGWLSRIFLSILPF